MNTAMCRTLAGIHLLVWLKTGTAWDICSFRSAPSIHWGDRDETDPRVADERQLARIIRSTKSERLDLGSSPQRLRTSITISPVVPLKLREDPTAKLLTRQPILRRISHDLDDHSVADGDWRLRHDGVDPIAGGASSQTESSPLAV